MPTDAKPPFPAYPPSTTPQAPVKPKPKRLMGFALMDPQRVREIASLGGKTAHQEGRANTWNSQTGREAAYKSVEVKRAKRSARIQAMSRPADSNNQGTK